MSLCAARHSSILLLPLRIYRLTLQPARFSFFVYLCICNVCVCVCV